VGLLIDRLPVPAAERSLQLPGGESVAIKSLQPIVWISVAPPQVWGVFVLAFLPINLAMEGPEWIIRFFRFQGIPSIVLLIGLLAAIGMWKRAKWGGYSQSCTA
jgi:hypothetical protein